MHLTLLCTSSSNPGNSHILDHSETVCYFIVHISMFNGLLVHGMLCWEAKELEEWVGNVCNYALLSGENRNKFILLWIKVNTDPCKGTTLDLEYNSIMWMNNTYHSQRSNA